MNPAPETTAATTAEFGHLASTVGTLLECSGVLFDFNGTLSDDEGIYEELFIELAARECGLDLTRMQYRSDLHGHSDREITEAIMALAGTPAAPVEKFLNLLDGRYNEAVAQHGPISRGARELVGALHTAGIRLGVVTGAGRATVLPALERAGLLDLFGVIVTQDDVRDGKPDPEGLRKAAQALGLAGPGRVVVFEDSVPGLRAAAAAGMVPVAVAGIPPREVILPLAAVVVERLAPDCLRIPLRPTRILSR
ncbi:HAD family hydrolase [Pseudarthrobacter sp. Y6]|uniref:HAD family hydrolase n=1 Tax=Pseudarthrobacter sp. Y6 TaxID=3418422 RepID=UPI003CE8204B